MAGKPAVGGAVGASSQLAQSFPAPLFAVLDPPAFLNAHLSTPKGPETGILRPSGRRPSESSTPSIHAKAPLANAAGSAVVRVGDAACVAGVRMELLDVKDCPDLPREFLEEQKLEEEKEIEEDLGDAKDEEITEAMMSPTSVDPASLVRHLRLLVPNVELATGSSPLLLPGSAPTTLAQSTASQLLSLMHTLPVLSDPAQLVIREAVSPGKQKAKGKVIAFWTLYIDVTVLSISAHSSASLLSAILPCVLGALKGVSLPRVRRDDNIDGLVCDSRRETHSPLKMNEKNPAVVAFHVFEPSLHKGLSSTPLPEKQKKYILADADALEGDMCSEEIMVVVEGSGDKKGIKLRSIVKMGGSAATPEDMRNVFALAEERWRVWDELLQNLDTEP